MSENNQPNTVANDRRRRINRLKKIIIIVALILILIPIVLCVILLFKVNSMQKTIDELMVLKDTGTIIAQHNEEGKVYYVYASAIEDKLSDEKEPETDKKQQSATLEKEPEVETDNIVQADDDTSEDTTESEQASADTEEVTQESVAAPEQIDTGKYVYLTFDDGPSIQTEKILKILDEHNVTATFFVIGKDDEKSLERYKAIVDSGNSIGLHSYTHDYEEIYASVENFAIDLQRISDLVYSATGVRSNLFRFPGGSSNSIVSDINVYIDYLNQNGYTYFDWNSSSRDAASVMPPKEDIINTVVSEVEGRDNVVVLMHDSERKESTVEALPKLIEKLKAMGYTIKGIDENSIPVQHR